MKFDVIISNPPYQLNTVSGETTNVSKQAKPIYNLFVEQAKKLNPKYITMIIPSRWFAGGLGLDSFRQDMMNDPHITHLVGYTNAKDCFPQNVTSFEKETLLVLASLQISTGSWSPRKAEAFLSSRLLFAITLQLI